MRLGFILVTALLCSQVWFSSAWAGEKPITPIYPNLPTGWMDLKTQDLSLFWASQMLDERGVNFYSTGGLKEYCFDDKCQDYLTRFDPESPYYQSWVGTYIVESAPLSRAWIDSPDSPETFDLTVERGIELASIDQDVWLFFFGFDNFQGNLSRFGIDASLWEMTKEDDVNLSPSRVDYDDEVKLERLKDGTIKISLWLHSHSDVGDRKAPIANPFQNVLIPYKYLEDKIEPYHKLRLYCQMWIKPLSLKRNTFALTYSSQAEYTLKDGRHFRPDPKVAAEIEEIVEAISFRIPPTAPKGFKIVKKPSPPTGLKIITKPSAPTGFKIVD